MSKKITYFHNELLVNNFCSKTEAYYNTWCVQKALVEKYGIKIKN